MKFLISLFFCMQIIVVLVPQKVGAAAGLNTAVMGVIQFLANLNTKGEGFNDDGKRKIQQFIDENSLDSRARLLAELKSRYVELFEKKRNSKQSGLEFNPSSDINDVDKLTGAEVRRLNNWALAIDQLDSHVDNRDRTLTKKTRKISDFPINKPVKKKKIKRVKLELPPIRSVRKNTIKPQQKVDPDLLKGIALNQVMLRDKKDKAKLKAEDDKIKKETMQAIAELKETNDKLVKMERKYDGIIYDILEEQRLDITTGGHNAAAIQDRLDAAYQELFDKRQVKADRIAELKDGIRRTEATINKNSVGDFGYADVEVDQFNRCKAEEAEKYLAELKRKREKADADKENLEGFGTVLRATRLERLTAQDNLTRIAGRAKLREKRAERQKLADNNPPQIALMPVGGNIPPAYINDVQEFLRIQNHNQAAIDGFQDRIAANGDLYPHLQAGDLERVKVHINEMEENLKLDDLFQ